MWAIVKIEVDPKNLQAYSLKHTLTPAQTSSPLHPLLMQCIHLSWSFSMTSFPFVAAWLPCAFGSCTEAWQGHIVFLEAWIGCSLSFPLPLRGEEGVLETHAWGRGLENETTKQQWVNKTMFQVASYLSFMQFTYQTYAFKFMCCPVSLILTSLRFTFLGRSSSKV